jgi:hypothetical protein
MIFNTVSTKSRTGCSLVSLATSLVLPARGVILETAHPVPMDGTTPSSSKQISMGGVHARRPAKKATPMTLQPQKKFASLVILPAKLAERETAETTNRYALPVHLTILFFGQRDQSVTICELAVLMGLIKRIITCVLAALRLASGVKVLLNVLSVILKVASLS